MTFGSEQKLKYGLFMQNKGKMDLKTSLYHYN